MMKWKSWFYSESHVESKARFFFCFTLALASLSAMAASGVSDGYVQRDVMECGGVDVELVSSCRSVAVEEGEAQPLPVCSDQTININGKVLRRDVGRVSQLTTDGKSTRMLANVVVAMACMKGTKGSLVFIGGYGGCGACPEWFGYYSTAGKLVSYSYSNNVRSFGSKGSDRELIEAYGVTAKALREQNADAKRITYGQP
ncbi:hypothetical protein [Pseudomonas helvetica]|uniref:hypothetical protein n=1 Tax=Pseudomonas helvetica TaxID=3136738 RepID=UPI0032652226